MGQFSGQFSVTNGSGTYTVKVLKCSDNTQVGSTVTLTAAPTTGTTSYAVTFPSNTVGSYKVEICDGTSCFQTPCQNLSCCFPVSGLNIQGQTSGMANQTGTYSISYLGDPPLSYLWSITGQGTGLISGNSNNTVTFKFGNSGNAVINLSLVDCQGNTVSSSLTVNQQQVVVIINNITATGSC